MMVTMIVNRYPIEVLKIFTGKSVVGYSLELLIILILQILPVPINYLKVIDA